MANWNANLFTALSISDSAFSATVLSAPVLPEFKNTDSTFKIRSFCVFSSLDRILSMLTRAGAPCF